MKKKKMLRQGSDLTDSRKRALASVPVSSNRNSVQDTRGCRLCCMFFFWQRDKFLIHIMNVHVSPAARGGRVPISTLSTSCNKNRYMKH